MSNTATKQTPMRTKTNNMNNTQTKTKTPKQRKPNKI